MIVTTNKIKQYPLESSPLYRLSNKRKLEATIGLEKYSLNKTSKHIKYSDFKIPKNDGKKRPVTAPYPYLKRVQRSLHSLLARIEKPAWLISGTKGKCYIDNAKYHQQNQSQYAVTLDIKDFYSNCTRNYVFSFFSRTMKMPNDVAGALADILTYRTSIPVGSPTSQLLAFFAYKDMFEELHSLALSKECIFTVYVDDLAFSSKTRINHRFLINDVAFILGKNGHKLKWKKMKIYSKNESKLFTGVILDAENRLRIPNKLHNKIRKDKERLENVENMEKSERITYMKQFHGRIISARNIEPTHYKELDRAVKSIRL